MPNNTMEGIPVSIFIIGDLLLQCQTMSRPYKKAAILLKTWFRDNNTQPNFKVIGSALSLISDDLRNLKSVIEGARPWFKESKFGMTRLTREMIESGHIYDNELLVELKQRAK